VASGEAQQTHSTAVGTLRTLVPTVRATVVRTKSCVRNLRGCTYSKVKSTYCPFIPVRYPVVKNCCPLFFPRDSLAVRKNGFFYMFLCSTVCSFCLLGTVRTVRVLDTYCTVRTVMLIEPGCHKIRQNTASCHHSIMSPHLPANSIVFTKSRHSCHASRRGPISKQRVLNCPDFFVRIGWFFDLVHSQLPVRVRHRWLHVRTFSPVL
jgi:hypothetical protein